METDRNKVVFKPIKELKPYKKNAKKHPKEQVEQIANSIREFGFTQPVLIDSENNVVAGHGRVLGAKKAGLKEVPTLCLSDLTPEQIKAYRLADNKLNESEWDYSLLNAEVEELTPEIDMGLFGFGVLEQTEEEEEVEKEVEPDIPFTKYIDENSQYIVLKFNNTKDWLYVQTLFGLKRVKAYSTRKDGKLRRGFMKMGLGRVIDGMDAIRTIRESSYD